MTTKTTTPQEVIDKARDAEGHVVIAEYNVTLNALLALEKEYDGVLYDVTTSQGMKDAKAARQRLRKLRTGLEAKRKKLKAPILDYTKSLDGEAKAITARITAIEDPIDEQIKKEEQRAERERVEREEAERKRLGAIRERIEAIRATPGNYLHASSKVMEEAMDTLMADPLEGFEELEREAAIVRDEAVARLYDNMTLAKEREREREELEELRRFKAEQQAKEEAREKAEKEIPPAPEPEHVGADPGAGDDRTVRGYVPGSGPVASAMQGAPATRSPALEGFLAKHGSRAKAAPGEHWFDVEVEWSGYSRGNATYRVKAATASDAMERWADGDEIERTVVRDDTEKEPVAAMVTEIAQGGMS